MIRKIILAPMFLIALLFSQFVLAHGSDAANKSSTCACKHPMKKMMSSLQLNSEQEAKIHAIKAQTKPLIQEYWKQIKTLNQQINSLSMSDKVDEAKLNDLIKQKTDLNSKIMKNRVITKNQIYHVLTPAQQQQLTTMMSQWRNNAKASHGKCQCKKAAAQ